MNFYKSTAWKNKQKKILRRDEYLCQECKRYGKSTKADTVHHIIPISEDKTKRLDSHNLISLCGDCHNKMHNRVTNELSDKGLDLRSRKYPPSS
ncbi:hypothetical protein HMPREF9630_00567 [Peptoanaerobacter stomatis]|uniref:Putative HNH nuclease YajD n=1 Tax=Peptoanaerobacter stomatis TaxID=796937 RepID=V9HKI9_9FIRM|nr:HNH endonuclease signature motif containing protein [Peptoanaerobacter stomatis]EHL17400.1 hypothetical protein HMPREF9630_00567 [Peptoanaerobacter stomatis]